MLEDEHPHFTLVLDCPRSASHLPFINAGRILDTAPASFYFVLPIAVVCNREQCWIWLAVLEMPVYFPTQTRPLSLSFRVNRGKGEEIS